MKRAKLHTGEILEYEDDPDDATMDARVREHLAKRQPPPSSPPPPPPPPVAGPSIKVNMKVQDIANAVSDLVDRVEVAVERHAEASAALTGEITQLREYLVACEEKTAERAKAQSEQITKLIGAINALGDKQLTAARMKKRVSMSADGLTGEMSPLADKK